jgi:hypothetical protein
MGGKCRRGTLQLAMYAYVLGAGCNLTFRSIQCATVKEYIKDVATFLMLFSNEERDYRYDSPNSTRMSPLLHNVFEDIRKWDEAPNRREPFTIEMLEWYRDWVVKNKFDKNSLESVMLDWFEIGLFNGNRAAEWSQEGKKNDPNNPRQNARGDTYAFCLNDVRVQLKNGRRVTGAQILKYPVESIVKMWIRWKMQKNGEHGEEKMFTLPLSQVARSFIRPMYRILKRFVELRGSLDFETPLSVYEHPKLGVRLVNSSNTETHMRFIAANVYGLDPNKPEDRKALQRWSSHSLRVGACVILHAMGFDAVQIKFILRWKSDTFMLYLRNNGVLADKQLQAFDKLSAMPNF